MDIGIEIRPVRPEEYAAAGAATARAYREFAPSDREHGDWAAYLKRIADVAGRAARTTVLVALDDGAVVGSATLELNERIRDDSERPLGPDEAHLRMLGVDPDHRRKGIARQLVLACIDAARTAGKRRLTLDTGPVMKAARAMYEAMHFTPAGTRELDNGFCLYSYEMRLDAARAGAPQ